MLDIASIVNLVLGLVGTNGHIFVLYKTFTCLEMGTPLE
jgi:hypothetical protein